jgi:hypothetical protein
MRRALARVGAVLALAAALAAPPAAADEIRSDPHPRVAAPLDILRADIRLEPGWALFRMELRGSPISLRLARTARGARPEDRKIVAYIWPTAIDPSAVGFERASGSLALAVMAHPDFDDTPLFDENADGNPDNDGATWHMHWLVLVPDDACGRGAFRVRDIPQPAPGAPERQRPALPPTWPGVPVLIDSPGYSARIAGNAIEVRVPFADLAALRGVAFDGFTAELRLAAPGTVPLLCVTPPIDSASGNLSLPGRIH